jgi:hypothetical protein
MQQPQNTYDFQTKQHEGECLNEERKFETKEVDYLIASSYFYSLHNSQLYGLCSQTYEE